MSEFRRGTVFFKDKKAGVISETERGYEFVYDKKFLESPQSHAVSLTLPLREEAYFSKTLFPFFDGLIPEGWLLEVTVKSWKLDTRDRMGILLAACRDCIGAVSVVPENTEGKHE